MDGAQDTCFGCGQRNELGLRMRFQLHDDGSVEAKYVTPNHFAGAPGVVHGGIQAAMLDEVQGIAVHSALGPEARIATAEFRLRYRRPVPDEQPLTLAGGSFAARTPAISPRPRSSTGTARCSRGPRRAGDASTDQPLCAASSNPSGTSLIVHETITCSPSARASGSQGRRSDGSGKEAGPTTKVRPRTRASTPRADAA